MEASEVIMSIEVIEATEVSKPLKLLKSLSYSSGPNNRDHTPIYSKVFFQPTWAY